MYCASCGAAIPAEAQSCGSCGTRLAKRCLHCAASVPPTARFCPNCGESLPAVRTGQHADGNAVVEAPAGERKLVTVLFADLAGFTAFSAERDPEELQEYLSGLWTRLDAVIAAHGGATEKHIGDAIMAMFGAERYREEDPAQAVRAALAVHACLAQFQPGGASAVLQMRIGIHTGMVALGPMGTAGERTAIGDSVNLASRLQNSAPVGGVLISQDTYRQVYGLFDVQSLPPVSLRGRRQPVQTYLVLRPRPRSLARTLRGVEGIETEMIGRAPELQALKSSFLFVVEKQQLQVVTVMGEAGVGKSRLLHEFQKWVEVLPH